MAMDLTQRVQFAMAITGDDRVKTAVKGVQDGLWDTERAVGAAKAALLGLAGIASFNAFKQMVMGTIEATGALHDLSIQSGMSVAALQAFKGVGSYTSTSIDTITAASNRLSKSLAQQNEDSKGAAQAIAALGLDFNAFKALSPEQQMLEVAKAMNQFADGSGKSAAAMLLYGKQGAELLPFLADLADDADRVSAAMSEQNVALRAAQAAMSDAFGDNLTALRKNSEGWKKDLAMGLLPALYEGSEALKQMMTGTNGLSAEVSRLAKDGTLADWARGAVTAFSYLIDVAQGLFTLLPMLGNVIAGVAAGTSVLFGSIFDAMNLLRQGDFGGAWEAIKGGFAGVRTVATETATAIGDLWGQKLLGATFRERMADLQGVGVAAKEAKPHLDISEPLAKSAKAGAEARSEFEKLTDRIDDLVARQAQQIQQGAELSEADKLMVKAKQELVGAELQQITVKLRLAKTQEAEIAGMKATVKWLDETERANERAIDAEARRVQQLRDQVDAQDEATFKLGMSADQLRLHEIAVLRDRAALAARKADMMAEINLDMAAEYRRQAEALGNLADARQRFFDKQAAVDAANGWASTFATIGDQLYDAMLHGWTSFRDWAKANAIKLLLQPLLQQGVGAVGSWIGSLLGGSTGTAMQAGGNLLQTASTANTAYGWLSGNTAAGANYAAVASGQAYGTGFGSQQSMMLAAQESGMVSSAGSSAWASAGAYAFYAALVYAAAQYGSRLYDKGYTGSNIVGDNPLYRGGVEDLTTRGLKGLGLSDKWAEILGGSVRMNFTLEKLGLQETPHVGGYSLATAGGVQDITKQQGGRQNAAMQEWTDSFSKDMLKLVDNLASSLGVKSGVAGVRSVFESDNRDGSWGLFHLLDSAGKIVAGRDMLGTLDRDPAKGFQQYTDQAAGAIVDALERLDLPKWVTKQLGELSGDTTLQDLGKRIGEIAAVRQSLDDMAASMSPLGGVFAALAQSSSDAKYSLVELSGGLQAFQQRVSDYVANYYSQDERMAISASQLLGQAKGLGLDGLISGFGSRSDLRAALDKMNPEQDTKSIADLLGLSSAFAPLGDYLSQNNLTLGDLAAQAPQVAALDALRTPAEVTAEASQRTADSSEATAESVQGLRADMAGLRSSVDQLTNTMSRVFDTGDGVLDVRITA